VLTACIGAVCLAASLMGWLFHSASLWQRIALFVAALLLIKPGIYTDMVGLALLAVVASVQLAARRRVAAAAPATATLERPGG
jgi:TRAP-type uncharacterized transport system fused permease subunit